MKASWSVSDGRIDDWWSDYGFHRVVMQRGLLRVLVLNLSGYSSGAHAPHRISLCLKDFFLIDARPRSMLR